MNQNIKNNLFLEDTNSYSINTADIWENEQKIVFSDKAPCLLQSKTSVGINGTWFMS